MPDLVVTDFYKWSNAISYAYYEMLCARFTGGKQNHTYLDHKLGLYKVPENIFVDLAACGVMPIYDLPPFTGKDINDICCMYTKNERWYRRRIKNKKENFLVPHSTYYISNYGFVNIIDKILMKFGQKPGFTAIISMGNMYPNFDEVMGGVGFFYYIDRRTK